MPWTLTEITWARCQKPKQVGGRWRKAIVTACDWCEKVTTRKWSVTLANRRPERWFCSRSCGLKSTWQHPEVAAARRVGPAGMWDDPARRAGLVAAQREAQRRPDVIASKSAASSARASTDLHKARFEAARIAVRQSPARWAHASAAKSASLRNGGSAKLRATLKRNKSYLRSGPEDRLYPLLVAAFGQVERQPTLNGWSLDFYIPTIATYLQVDGVYWHGLDRPRAIIEQRASKHDARILDTMDRDVRQNAFCDVQCIRLVRVTDLDLTALAKAGRTHEWISTSLGPTAEVSRTG